jgi:hypothetical protein
MDSAIEYKNNNNPTRAINMNCYEDSKITIIKLQAYIKGFINRQKFKSTFEHIKKKPNTSGNSNSDSKPLIVLFNITYSQKKD